MSIVISIPETELWDPLKEQFVKVKAQKITMEHSLLSVDKWESKWKKSYLSSTDKTAVEILDYLRCMTLTKNVDPYVYYAIPREEMQRINDYITDPMTATTIKDSQTGKSRSREIITSEVIYWQMSQLNIPFEWGEKKHLNKLLMLIQVAAIKNQPPKKMKPGEIARQNKSLNAARRAKHHSRG